MQVVEWEEGGVRNKPFHCHNYQLHSGITALPNGCQDQADGLSPFLNTLCSQLPVVHLFLLTPPDLSSPTASLHFFNPPHPHHFSHNMSATGLAQAGESSWS